ncbi:MAG TPA: glycosyltransferase family 1 protein [Candidatus Baltobacteraceae bacterium]|nr:glycosyltransferase family 1 protein [Candidatus Baltobacteraceae bacterium]
MRQRSSFVHVVRLAVDARDLASDTRGIGRYTRAILRRLAARDDFEITLLAFGPFVLRHRGALRRALGTQRFRLASTADAGQILWHPANGTFFRSAGPSVATIHDAVPFRFPDPDPRRREQQQAPFLRSVETCRTFIAVSEFGKSEILDVFSISTDRVVVIHHGVDPVFHPAQDVSSTHDVPKPYVLFIGDPVGEPRKNFPLLLRAFKRAFAQPTVHLVVAGSRDPSSPGVYYAGLAGADARGSGDARLRSLYAGALALCVPSYYETFGMPMIEAMACGTPVLASAASCLPEIAGDAALYAPPHSVEAWAENLSRIAQDAALRANLRAAGFTQAARYDWNQSARRHAQVFAAL